jgi:hypothetical protein
MKKSSLFYMQEIPFLIAFLLILLNNLFSPRSRYHPRGYNHFGLVISLLYEGNLARKAPDPKAGNHFIIQIKTCMTNEAIREVPKPGNSNYFKRTYFSVENPFRST